MSSARSGRVLVEGIVIVASILLAFGIEAAWANRGEQRDLEQLRVSLQADVIATQAAIDEREQWAETVAADARAILGAMARGESGAALDSVVFTLGNVFVKGRWAPINHTYEQALASGDLALIREAELRFMLGRYAEGLENVADIQRTVVTQYYSALEPFMVVHTDYAEIAWDVQEAGLVGGLFTTNAAALVQRRDFANLLNLKLELELEMVDALRDVEALAAQLAADLGQP